MIQTPEGSGPLFDVGQDAYSRQALLLMRLQDEQRRALYKRNLVNRALACLAPEKQAVIEQAFILTPLVYSRPTITYNHGAYAREWEEGIAFKATQVDNDGSLGHPEVSQPIVSVNGSLLFPHPESGEVFSEEDGLVVHALAKAVKTAYWNGQLPNLARNCASLHDPELQPWIRPERLPMGPVLQTTGA